MGGLPEAERLIPERCSLCKGSLKKGQTALVIRVEDEILTITDVPAYVCEDCEEAYISPETSRRIDRLMEKYHRGDLCLHPVKAGELALAEI